MSLLFVLLSSAVDSTGKGISGPFPASDSPIKAKAEIHVGDSLGHFRTTLTGVSVVDGLATQSISPLSKESIPLRLFQSTEELFEIGGFLDSWAK